MIEIRQTEVFRRWFERLSDRRARLLIQVRIDRLAVGNRGDHRALQGGIFELRIDHGPGCRIYCCEQAGIVVVLLRGGDKRTQQRDIEWAQAMARQLED